MMKKFDKIFISFLIAAFAAVEVCAAPAPAASPRGRASVSAAAAPAAASSRGGRGVVSRTSATSVNVAVPAPAPEPEPEPAAAADSNFARQMESITAAPAVDTRAEARERIEAREQAEAAAVAFNRGIAAAAKSKCETELTKCVIEDCGADMQKCSNDADALWSARFQRCRTKVDCTGAELSVYGDIIKEDIRVDAKIALAQKVVEGNNAYSRCLQQQCGADSTSLIEGRVGFNGCMTQVKINNAINACKGVYEKYREYDSGLQQRFTGVMGLLRSEKEKNIAVLQKELDTIMPQMRTLCTQTGAMFDERSAECVFTAMLSVEDPNNGRRYTAGNKKIMPGSEYQCSDRWFGVDVTQYLINSAHLTATQRAASSAFMGAGVGVGLSALTRGLSDKAGSSGEGGGLLGSIKDKVVDTAKGSIQTDDKKDESQPTDSSEEEDKNNNTANNSDDENKNKTNSESENTEEVSEEEGEAEPEPEPKPATPGE